MVDVHGNLHLHGTWSKISNGIKNIYQYKTISPEAFTKLRGYVKAYCTYTEPQATSSTQNSGPNNVSDDVQYQAVRGGELYHKITEHLKAYLEEICEKGLDLQGEDMLDFYITNWEQYHSSSTLLDDCCQYLNQNLVQGTGVYKVSIMAMKLRQQIFFTKLKDQVTLACLHLIKSERNNGEINTQLIKKVIKTFTDFGFALYQSVPISSNQIIYPTLILYKFNFETKFLTDTEEFYRNEASTFLVHNSVTEYLKKIVQRLHEEVHRIQSYLHSSTLAPLIKKVEEVLIRDQLEAIYNEAKTLLRDEKHQDLSLLFKVVSRVPNATLELKKIVEDHIHQMGIDAIERVSGSALNDPKLYVETILDIHTKFFKLVQEAFNSEQRFTAALDEACGQFVNNNAVTTAAGTTTKSPELLARYCDALLRKGSKAVEETDLEEKFNQIMVVFNYVEDKYVFQKFYGKILAKRLAGQLSASSDYETSMVSKLTQACDSVYTLKLRQMLQDIGISKNLIDQYRKYCENRTLDDNVDFSVMVFRSNSWLFSASPTLLLPAELKQTFDSFTNFYTQQHKGRKLTCFHQHSTGYLKTLYTEPEYILHVSIYQMVVLLLFNKFPSWTVERIQNETKIERDLLVQVLLDLLKAKLIICPQINDEELKRNDIKTNYNIHIAEHFESKQIEIDLNSPSKSIDQKEFEDLHRTIDQDRTMVIQSTIVRIMRDRQIFEHELLMQEVINQLSSRFEPKIHVIKKCIDLLIQKEYLERQPNAKQYIRYLG